jgi:hypothetical protein
MFGVGIAIGSLFSSFALEIDEPWLVFGIHAGFCIFMTIAGAMTDDILETNEYAQIIDPFVEEYHSNKKPSCCVLICYKLKTLCKAVSNPLILRFFLFLTLQGLVMPSFAEFEYYFATEVLGIEPSAISL